MLDRITVSASSQDVTVRAAAEIIAKIKCRIICVIIEQEQPLLMMSINVLRRLPYPSSNSDNSEDSVYDFGCDSTNEIDIRES